MPPQIPGYRIERVLGKGGMATVYLAVQAIFERPVALKVMAKSLAENPDFGQRFFREARIVSQLVHPNIVTVYDVGVFEDAYYLSMEYINGTDLKHACHHLSPQQKIQVIEDIARALEFSGAKGYVHRDIKPENIMVEALDLRAVLMDFGIARAGEGDISVTQTGIAIGTPHYMSPEQAKGLAVDCRSDLYSLGVVFFWLLTGRVPYDGDSAVAIGIKHIVEPVPLLPEAYSAAQPVIDALMAKLPQDRYGSASGLLQDLATLKTQAFWWPNASATAEASYESQPTLPHHALPATQLSSALEATQIIAGQPFTQAVAPATAAPLRQPFALAGAAVLVAASAGLWWYLSPTPAAQRPFQTLVQSPAVAAHTPAPPISQAEAYLQQGFLYYPPEACAYFVYKSTPTNSEAQKALQDLPAQLTQLAPKWVAEGQFLHARQQMQAALLAQPNNKILQAAQQKIDALITQQQLQQPEISALQILAQPSAAPLAVQPAHITPNQQLFVIFKLGARTPPHRLTSVLYRGARGQRVVTLQIEAAAGVVSFAIPKPAAGWQKGLYTLDILNGNTIIASQTTTLTPNTEGR